MRKKSVMLVALLAAFLCIASLSPVAYAQWQEYYVLGNESASLLCAYENMSYGELGGHVNGTVSIVAWESVNVTVDKDENGYTGSDITQDLGTGEIWTLDTSDLGGDYIRANGSISVVRTAWWFNATAGLGWPGTFVAGTWELYPTGAWGTNYVVAITTPYTQLIVQAMFDNTDVTVGGNPPVTLNRGEDLHVANVSVETTIIATKNIQAGILTNKELGGGYGLDTRYYTLTPKKVLGNDYYIPVPSFAQNYTNDTSMVHVDPVVRTNLTIYAFNATEVTIEDGSGFSTTFTMGAATINKSYMMPAISGGYINESDSWLNGSFAAHVYANDTIWVLGSADDTDDDFDWGFQGVNTSVLRDRYYVPWSPANPAYVTPIADATFHVDLNVDGTDEYSFTLNRLNMSTIYPSSTNYTVAPLNLTGARIWTDDNVSFAIMWGQDNNEDTPGERPTANDPDNDFGYTVLYVPVYEVPEPGTVDGYVYGDRIDNCSYDGLPNEPGVENVTVELVNVTTGGVVNTTTTDNSGYYKFTNITAGNYTVIYIVGTLPGYLSPKCDDDSAEGSGIPAINASNQFNVPEGGSRSHNFAVESTADVDIGIVKFVDDVKSKMVVHNQTVTFTLNVTNTGNATLKEIVVNDTLPAKLTFVNAAPPCRIAQLRIPMERRRSSGRIIWQQNSSQGTIP